MGKPAYFFIFAIYVSRFRKAPLGMFYSPRVLCVVGFVVVAVFVMRRFVLLRPLQRSEGGHPACVYFQYLAYYYGETQILGPNVASWDAKKKKKRQMQKIKRKSLQKNIAWQYFFASSWFSLMKK